MPIKGLIATLVFAWFSTLPSRAQVFPGATWEERTPEEVGLDPAVLDQFVAATGGDGVVVKDGYLVRKWGGYSARADWASAMKPVMSTLLAMAIQEGLVGSVDDLLQPVVQAHFGQDLAPKDQTMTWRHLADMTSGYARAEAPGAAWAYNDTAIMLYSVLLFDAVFGQSPDAAATGRLAALGFEDGGLFGSRSGRGLNASPRDFARIGWLWLNRGRWDGARILPAALFDQILGPDVPVDLPRTAAAGQDTLGVGSIGGGTDQTAHGPGIYGFNWWHNAPTPAGPLTWPDAPADTYQANGHWNQEVLTVIPSLGMVVACRGSWGEFDPGNLAASMNARLALLADALLTGPQPGQIMVDPANPATLVRNGIGPLHICGPGDPEDFLYRGTRNADGTRDGDQLALIDKLAQHGGNSIYMQIVRSHGGDGAPDHNPFVNSDPAGGLDEDILAQWETWFSAMDAAGIVITLFFYDDSARIWDTGDTVGPQEQAFIQGIVDRFQHHRNLIWVVAEESEERLSHARVRAIAEVIQTADDRDHPVANHHLSGTDFKAWQPGCALDQFAIQYNQDTPEAIHAGVLAAWASAAGRYNLNMSEAANHGTGATMRLKNWAAAMAGAHVMVLGMDIASTSEDDLRWCRIQQRFFEATDFNTMEPHDELAAGDTTYVLARPGAAYIAYGDAAQASLGLRALAGGTYDLTWLDCVSGQQVEQADQVVGDGDFSWPKPAGFGTEVAAWIRRQGQAPDNLPPVAHDQQLSVEQPDSLDVQLTWTDPDGPGPYAVSIASGPDHGALTGDGAARIYQPEAGYGGEDAFSFRVNDGLVDSNVAFVQIQVDAAGNQPPTAFDGTYTTDEGTPVSIQLSYDDPDGPGPYAIDITTPPVHGTLEGTGNDRTYTPTANFVGSDQFTWTVDDGLASSSPATATIQVADPDGGIEPDGGADDGGDADGSGGDAPGKLEGGCGCGSNAAAGSPLVLLFLFAAFRRRAI